MCVYVYIMHSMHVYLVYAYASVACICICMYGGCSLWKCPWNREVQLGLGEGTINKVGPMSQLRGIIDTASLTLVHTHVIRCFLANFILGS